MIEGIDTMSATQLGLITEEELMALGADAQVEVMNGEVIRMAPVGMLHHIIAGNIYRALYTAVEQGGAGYVFMDGLICLLDMHGQGIRGAYVPDVCFIRKGRIPTGYDLARPFPGAPDLAVEVMSPDDSVETVLAKVRTYLAKGTEQVWVVYPSQKEIHQYLQGEKGVRVYSGDDVIRADSLVPGLSLRAEDLFS
ncbi:MAG: Uma2 family endonuclease, partial [Thermoplasmatota archaeon]